MNITNDFLRLRGGGANFENKRDEKLKKMSTSKSKDINFVVNMLR